MDFLKKNWVKLTLALVSLVGLILAIILLTDIPSGAPFMAIAYIIGYMVFFLGMLCYFIAKMMNYDKVAAGILLLFGFLTTLFFVLTLIEVSGDEFSHRIITFPIIIQLLAFGLFPLIRGINEFCMEVCGMGKEEPKSRAKAAE